MFTGSWEIDNVTVATPGTPAPAAPAPSPASTGLPWIYRGATNSTLTSGETVGYFTTGAVEAADVYGGAVTTTGGSRTNYVRFGNAGEPITLELEKASDFFGAWWSAGGPGDSLELFYDEQLVARFTTDLLKLPDSYKGSSSAWDAADAGKSFSARELFAFLNVQMAPGTYFNKVVFDGSIEADNFTLRIVDPKAIDARLANGIGTILDEGSGGDLFSANNTTGIPDAPGTNGLPLEINDDRPIRINDVVVNEASPFMVFTLSDVAENRTVQLALSSMSATVGTDISSTQLEWFDPVTQQWTACTPVQGGKNFIFKSPEGSNTDVPNEQLQVLIRVKVNQDLQREVSEKYQVLVEYGLGETLLAPPVSLQSVQAAGANLTLTAGENVSLQGVFETINFNQYRDEFGYGAGVIVWPGIGEFTQGQVDVDDGAGDSPGIYRDGSVTLELDAPQRYIGWWNEQTSSSGSVTLSYQGATVGSFSFTPSKEGFVNIVAEPGVQFDKVVIDAPWDMDNFTVGTVEGIGTILDDGTGAIYLASNTTGTPNAPTDPGYPARLDNDPVIDTRDLAVNNVTVNEGSPYVVFTVTGAKAQQVNLRLSDGTAAAGSDYTDALEYLSGGVWRTYDPNNPPKIPGTGTGNADLLVRVAITNDGVFDYGEKFYLNASNSAGENFVGTCTIFDDGTGPVFGPTNKTTTPDVLPAGFELNDDRPILINSVTVNEASPWMVFSLQAPAGDQLLLSLASGTAEVGADTGTELEVLVDGVWVPYTGAPLAVPTDVATAPGGMVSLLVRVAMAQDAPFEGAHSFTLTASSTLKEGRSTTGTGTIFDDGTGVLFAVDPQGELLLANGRPTYNTTAAKDNDQAPEGCYLPVQINLLANDYHDNGRIDPATIDLDPGTPGRQTSRAATYGGAVVGEFKASDDGTVLFTPNTAFRGQTDAISYSVADATGKTDTATLVIGQAPATVSNSVFNANSLELFIDNNASNRAITGTATSAIQSQTLTFALNPGNPGSSTHTISYNYNDLVNRVGIDTTALSSIAGSNPLKVTASLSGRVYDGSNNPVIQLGNDTIGSVTDATYLNWDSANPVGSTTYSSTLTGTGGLDRSSTASTANTGFLFKINPNALVGKPYVDANGRAIRYAAGQLTITFNEAVTNPLMHVYDFGGYNNDDNYAVNDISFSPELKLVGYTTADGSKPWLTVASTDSGDGAVITTQNGQAFTRAMRDSGLADGTLRVVGNGITSLTFDVSVLGANFTNVARYANWVNPGLWDWWNLSFTAFTRPPEANNDAATATKVCGINDVVVNEGSPYAVFKVEGFEGRLVKLDLASGTGTAGVDTGTTDDLEYWDGNAWQPYTLGSFVPVPGDGDGTQFEASHLLVRVPVKQDAPLEVSEQLTLTATYGSGNAVTGTLTILDNGQGNIYATSPTNPGVDANGNPLLDSASPKDNDRGANPMVNNITVNEGSSHAVFTVTGVAGAGVTLGLAPGTATSADYGSGLEVFNGTAWVPYSLAVAVLGADGALLVRAPVTADDVSDSGETFTLTATYNGTGTPASAVTVNASSTGTATLMDDGTGTIFTGTVANGTPVTDEVMRKDTDLRINNVTVNEASPYLVMTVQGKPGAQVTLNAQSMTALIGTDTGTQWQVFDASANAGKGAWVDYTMGASTGATLDAVGQLLVRVAVNQDAAFEVAEHLTLEATYTGVGGGTSGLSATGTGTIVDDGTGALFGAANTNGLPDAPGRNGVPITLVIDNDRPLQVSGTTVNEASPWVLWTVSGDQGQRVQLALQNGTGLVGTDTGTALQYYNGSAWVDYLPGTYATIPTVSAVGDPGSLVVRTTPVVDAPYELSETVLLKATTVGGISAVGASTILDESSGAMYGANVIPVLVTGQTVTEAPGVKLGFTVTGKPGETVTLALQSGSATVGSDTTANSLEVLVGGAWTPYTTGMQVTLPADGKLQVRVAVTDDDVRECSETLTLVATPSSGVAARGEGTIVDNESAGLAPLINSITVNEASPYAVFTVEGVAGAGVTLTLAEGTAKVDADGTPLTDGLEDYGSILQVFNGTAWVAYDANTRIAANGKLLVRMAVVNDAPFEVSEQFTLTVAYTGQVNGAASPAVTANAANTGTATILDDGTGAVFVTSATAPGVDAYGDPQLQQSAELDDDRAPDIYCAGPQGDEISLRSRLVVSSFHSAFYRAADGGYFVSGENASSTGTSLSTPIYLSAANGYTFTGQIIDVAAGGVNPQHLLLTTDGLYAWGRENQLLGDNFTASRGFQKVALPAGLNPADVRFMSASSAVFSETNANNGWGGVALVMKDGSVWMNTTYGGTGQSAIDSAKSLQGAGLSNADTSAFKKVSFSDGSALTGITHLEVHGQGVFAYNATTGRYYTWGPKASLGDGSAAAPLAYATEMTAPPLPSGVTLVQLGVTGDAPSITPSTPSGVRDGLTYFVLGSDGRVYTLGDNSNGVAGQDNQAAVTRWTTVKNEFGTGPLEQVEFISTQNSTTGRGNISAIQTGGRLLSWGADASHMLGLDNPSSNYLALLPKEPSWKDNLKVPVYAVEAGGHFTVAVPLGMPGLVAAVGHNLEGAFGDGSKNDRSVYELANFIGSNAGVTLANECQGFGNDLLRVNNLVVNEASPYAVFTVQAHTGEPLQLSLTNGTASVGLDTGTSLEYFDGTKWVHYPPGSSFAVPGSTPGAMTPVLVRVAIGQDAPLEVFKGMGEKFFLNASYANGSQPSAIGVCEIRDDGAGALFGAGNTTGISDPLRDPAATTGDASLPTRLDDDFPITITGQTVNEASPTLVFTVSGHEGQPLTLSLQNVTPSAYSNEANATLGTDTGVISDNSTTTALEVFNAVTNSWVPYTTGQLLMLPDNGTGATNEAVTVLVRVTVKPDASLEGKETLQLVATTPSGMVSTGTGTIVDNGTGALNAASGAVSNGAPVADTTTAKDNDGLGLPIIDNPTRSEADGYMQFFLQGVPGASVDLQLRSLSADAASDLSAPLMVLDATGYFVPLTADNAIFDARWGELIVRVPVQNELVTEAAERFTLTATYNNRGVTTGITVGGSATGVATILDDDLPVSVTGGTVHEADGYLGFTVSTFEGQNLTLSLGAIGTGSGHAVPGTDTSRVLQYWNGKVWANYTAGSTVTAPDNGNGVAGEPATLLVRVALAADGVTEPTETLQLTATTASGMSDTGVGTILDGGTRLADDDRPLTVTGATVNEASPYLVFTVGGAEGQLVHLSLADGTAAVGADTGTQLQYFNGQAWVNYTPGSYVPILSDGDSLGGEPGQLLVRVAVAQDNLAEVSEQLALVAINTGGRPASDFGYIRDDGTGAVYPDALPVNGVPAVDASAHRDNDRPLAVNNVRVNEASPFAVFTVTGKPGDALDLALANGTAQGAATPGATDGSQDFGTALEVFNPVAQQWTPYAPGVVVPTSGNLLVRVAIVNDAPFEAEQTFTLTASYTSGNTPSATGTGTIVDDGTGALFATVSGASPVLGVDPATGLPMVNVLTPRNDDRGANPVVSDLTVNEGSPFAVFTVDAKPGSVLKLEPASGTALQGLDTGAQWQVLVNGTWTNYTPGANVTVGATGTVLARVAPLQDATLEVAEQFTLKATYTTTTAGVTLGGTSTGLATIVDDGTGLVFGADNKDGEPDAPGENGLPASFVKDNDRPLEVTGTTVNELSPYVVWTVDGAQGQQVKLALQNGTGTVGVDTGTALEYYNGSTWLPYTPASLVLVPTVTAAGEPGVLMVRTAPVQDVPYEMSETVLLKATNASGTSAVGASTILDDGTGALLGADVTPVVVTGQTVPESAGTLGFTVSGQPGETLTLALQNGSATVGSDTTPNSLQVLIGGTWTPYTGQQVLVPAGGQLQVRVAVTDDSAREGSETLTLVATPSSGIAAAGVGTIIDNEAAGAAPVVNSISVNEASPYAVFTVEGLAGAGLTLALGNDLDAATRDASLGTDTVQPSTGTPLQVFNGTAWVAYDPATTVVGANGKLLVRVALVNDTPYEVSERFTLTATYTGAGGGTANAASTGTATIFDDGTGTLFLAGQDADPATAGVQPQLGVDALGNPQTDELTPPNDDRTLAVNNLQVNEGSPYAVFTLTAHAGEKLVLALGNGTATVGTDTGTVLEVFNGTRWVPYLPGSAVTVPGATAGAQVPMLVRVAIAQDAPLETAAGVGEKFTLSASYAGSTRVATGTCEILDNGTGTVFATGQDNPATPEVENTGVSAGLPVLNTSAPKDNDNPLTVTGQTVAESAGWLEFSVAGLEGQAMTLALADGTAQVGLDTGRQLEVFLNNAWVPYTPGTLVSLPSDGDGTANEAAQLRVRVSVAEDSVHERSETLTLLATQPNGTQATGVGTITDNDPQGSVPAVNSLTVNEGSPYAVFTVRGVAGAGVTLALASGSATVGADLGSTLEVFDGTRWVAYSSAAAVVRSNGELLVRVAITQDAPYEVSETFSLKATYNSAGTASSGFTVGASATGTGTIVDDGTGEVFLSTRNSGAPNQPGDYGYPASLDDDRSLAVLGDTVYEAEGRLVFTVSGVEGQSLTLALSSGTATVGVDTGTQLEYWNGSRWVGYTAGTPVVLPGDGNGVPGDVATLQVRVAVRQDALSETSPEQLTLSATSATGKVASGVGVIKDGAPPVPASLLDDDRPLTVNDVQVNEASPYAVFTVSGVEGQYVKLALGATSTGDDALLGTDTGGAPLQYFDGSAWVDYVPGSYVPIPALGAALDGQSAPLLVRVAITDDVPLERAETFLLRASNTGGRSDVGLGTILDDGTGEVFATTPSSKGVDPLTGLPVLDTSTPRNDDRVLAVNDLTVNEASPYAVFTVTANAGETLALSLGSATGVVGQDTGTTLQVWNGSAWVTYQGAFTVPGTDAAAVDLLVRVALVQDAPYEVSETFKLIASYESGGPRSNTGVGTIVDDGSGDLFGPNNLDGQADAPGESGLPASLLKDDDRPLVVAGSTVNESSPYLAYTVSGVPGQSLTLALRSGTGTLGADVSDLPGDLEVWNGSAWVDYAPGTPPVIGANGLLQVRVAVKTDTSAEMPETIELVASNRTGTAFVGTGYILDGSDPAGAVIPDQAPLAVVGETVNEAVGNTVVAYNSTGYQVFKVTGAVGQTVTLALATTGSGGGHADLTDDLNASGSGYQTVTVDVLANDRAATGDSLAPASVRLYSAATGGAGATTLNVPNVGSYTVDTTTGAVTFTPVAGLTGTPAPIWYSVTNTGGAVSARAQISVAVGASSAGQASVPNAVTTGLRNGGFESNTVADGAILPSTTALTAWNTTGGVYDPGINDSTNATSLNLYTGQDNVDNNVAFIFNAAKTFSQTVQGLAMQDGVGVSLSFSLGVRSVNTTASNSTSFVGLYRADGTLLAAYGDNAASVPGATGNTALVTGGLYSTISNANANRGVLHPFTLTYTPTAADAGQGVIVKFGTTGATGYADFDSFALSGLATVGTAPNTANDGQSATQASSLEYFDGNAWVPYSGGSVPLTTGELLVRAKLNNDSASEVSETYQLVATDAVKRIQASGVGTILDNDAPTAAPLVNSFTVNEGSPFGVFTVTGAAGASVSLELLSGSATVGSDTGSTLEVFDTSTSSWVAYSSNSLPVMPSGGQLLVRFALVQDAPLETLNGVGETLQLKATYVGSTGGVTPGGSATGTATIMDDGTGTVFLTRKDDPSTPANEGNLGVSAGFAPQVDDTTAKDDDRVISVNNVTVNEASPFIVFEVSGQEGQRVNNLQLASGTATVGTDTGSTLEVWNGQAWVAYTAGTPLTLPSDGDLNAGEPARLLVRVAITQDEPYEMSESFTLTATDSRSRQAVGTGTILDDGTGDLFAGTVSNGTPDMLATAKDDDRPFNPALVNNLRINEGSPWAVFTVTGVPTAQLTLSLPAGTQTGNATLGTDYQNAMEVYVNDQWVPYDPAASYPYGTPANPALKGNAVLDSEGTLLVRVSLANQEAREGDEPFALSLSYTGNWAQAQNLASNVQPQTGRVFTGTAVIVDDGTGLLFGDANTTGTPDAPRTGTGGDASLPQLLDDDRPLIVNEVTVNEASGYLVWTVRGHEGQYVQLAMSAGSVEPEDYVNALEVFNGSAWVSYNPNSFVQIPADADSTAGEANAPLLVRVRILPDSEFERAETLTLVASNTGGSSSAPGLGTIVDDGTGTVFATDGSTVTGVAADGTPATSTLAKDDDRTVSVQGAVVNEASPYLIFTVKAVEAELLDLSLSSGSATVDVDTVPGLEVFLGGSWQPYSSSAGLTMPAANSDGDTVDEATVLVRVKLVQDPLHEVSENLTLKAQYRTGRQNSAQALGTILDEGHGTVFLSGLDDPATPGVQDPTGVGADGLPLTQPVAATPVADPAQVVLADDDRPLAVDSVMVNEGSPFAVFTAGGKEGQYVRLDLGATGTGAGHATLGTDTGTGTALQYWSGTAWTDYAPGSFVRIPADGDGTANEAANLLVRVAIKVDTDRDNGETFTLTATNTGGTAAQGTGTIFDDGTGDVFASQPTGTVTGVSNASATAPATPVRLVSTTDPVVNPAALNPATLALADDDRPVRVNSVEVNEASPYLVWTVTARQGQYVGLELGQTGTGAGHAELGTDTGTQLQYWNGSDWADYAPGSFVRMRGTDAAADTQLLVRVAVRQDQPVDSGETLTLTARNTGGTTGVGRGTILDNGTGTIFLSGLDDPAQAGTQDPSGVDADGLPMVHEPATDFVVTPGQAVLADNDRPLSVNNVTVNEASPYLVWTVGARQGQYVSLALGSTGSGDGFATPGTDTGDAQALQVFDGTDWVDYVPGTLVRVPGTQLTTDGNLLVRVAVKNDFRFEDVESLKLTATNASGTPATGLGRIRDDGEGLLFGPDNTTAVPDDKSALGLTVLDDDRVAPPMPQPAAAPPAPPEAPRVETAPALHVTKAVADGRSSTSAVGNQTMVAEVSSRASGQAGEGINTQRRLDNLIDKFDRPTDPNLYVLPEVKDTRGQSHDVKAPSIEIQSGILFQPSSGSATLPGIFNMSALPGEQSLSRLADAELERLAQAPQTAELPWWAAEAADEQALAEARLKHLALAHAVMQASAAAQPEAALEAQAAPGRLSFSQKLQASAQRPAAPVRG